MDDNQSEVLAAVRDELFTITVFNHSIGSSTTESIAIQLLRNRGFDVIAPWHTDEENMPYEQALLRARQGMISGDDWQYVNQAYERLH